MPIDILSIISTVLNDRQRQAALAQERDQFNANLGLQRDRFGLDQSRFAEDQSQFSRNFGLDEQRLGLSRDQFSEEQNQFGKTFAQRQLEADRGYGLSQEELAMNKRLREQEELYNLSKAVGSGASSPAQADILSLLAGKLGVNLNTAQLLNTAQIAQQAAGAAGAKSGVGSGKYTSPHQVEDWPGKWFGKAKPTQFSYDMGKTWQWGM